MQEAFPLQLHEKGSIVARAQFRLVVYLILDLLFLILALCNLPSVIERAKAPFDVDQKNDQLIIKRITHPEACPALQEGDKILLWNQHKVESVDEIEFLTDFLSIGEKVTLRFTKGENWNTAQVTLIPFYASLRFVIIMTIVGFVIWCMGVFVAFNRLDGLPAYSLHWALIGLALALLLTQGKISSANVFSLISRFGLLISYLLMAGLFFFFTTIYPRNKLGSIKLKASLIFLPSLTSIALTLYYFAEAVKSPLAIESYLQSYQIYHIILAIFAIGIIVSVLDSYRRAQTTEDRSRLQWILWGFVVGQSPFLLFILVPQILFSKDWVPEEYATVFLLATPFSFAVSFVRYRLLDVQVMINRSIVYAVLSIFIGLMYVLVIVLGTSLIGGEVVFTEYLIVMISAIVLAWLLNPLRLRLQHVIDETLFPARVHYRQMMTQFTDRLHRALSVEDIAQKVVQSSIAVMPLGSMAFYTRGDETFSCKYSYGVIPKSRFGVPLALIERMVAGCPIVLSSVLGSAERNIDISHEDWLKSIGFALCVPMLTESGNLQGIIAANPRGEKDRFACEEIELLTTIAAQASEILERLTLQKKVVLEQEERQKMEELNRLKSFFVSSVSHELRTPLTSIRMFAETLREGKIHSKKKQREYFGIIDRESERLSRLIDNVLDFSRVERGVKEYHFASTDIREVVMKAATAMKNQFDELGAKLHVVMSKSLPKIDADGDALEEAIINLLSNALKYSGSKKEITLKAQQTRKEIVIQVADKGVGMAKDELSRIFDPFYRVRDKQSRQVKGMGLGLSLIKHIVDGHGGLIEVQSKLGKGSQFTIRLPITDKNRGGIQ